MTLLRSLDEGSVHRRSSCFLCHFAPEGEDPPPNLTWAPPKSLDSFQNPEGWAQRGHRADLCSVSALTWGGDSRDLMHMNRSSYFLEQWFSNFDTSESCGQLVTADGWDPPPEFLIWWVWSGS